MFKKTKRKMVIVIMVGLIVLMTGALTVIYGFSYYEVSQRNREMLNVYVEMYSLEHQPGFSGSGLDNPSVVMNDMEQNGMSPSGAMQKEELKPSMEVSVFYSVAIGENGAILATDNHNSSVYSDAELIGFAQEIIEKNKIAGKKSNLLYQLVEKDEYILVAFMNNTVMQDSITTLFRYTLLFLGIIIVALYFFARYWAKQIVAPLEESYHKQKQFISDAGHELKTPVAIMAVNIDLLEKELSDNKWLKNIQIENARMKQLLNQMLKLTGTEITSTYGTKVDLTRLTQEMCLLFEPIAYEKGRDFKYKIAENIWTFGNENQLKQLWEILLDNAISHGLATAPICVVLTTDRNETILSVINAGEEIPVVEREKLFERFYRLDASRSSEGNHYGLGLPIAKNIVAAHKGMIEIFCYDDMVEFKVRLSIYK